MDADVLKTALRDLATKELATRVQQDLESLQRANKEFVEALEQSYGMFFDRIKDMLDETASAPDDAAPEMISEFLGNDGQWDSISDDWELRKLRVKGYQNVANLGSSYFYHGITDALAERRGQLNLRSKLGNSKKGSGLARVGAPRPKTFRPQSFADFVKSHRGDQQYVEKLFGKIEVDYELKSNKKTLKTKTVNNLIQSVKYADRKGMPSSFQIKSTISAFGVMVGPGKPFNEWAVVDRLIKQRDPLNELQWVKINGQRGHLRAIITPLIRWYFAYEFKAIAEDFTRELKP